MNPADPYLIQGTGTLRNRLNLESQKALAIAETDLTNARIIQLMDSDDHQLPNSRDARELRAIHFHLFQDVYDWAGHFRKVDIRRGNGEYFAPFSALNANIEHFSHQLADKHYLRIEDRSMFIAELAKAYDILNWIHPFREGNGRTQRHFWSRVAADAGWILDWRPIQGDLNEASRLGREERDLSLLVKLLGSVVSTYRQGGPLSMD
ncbi:Fic/DOC family protein [Corynebacterium flavescens]|uniref:Fic/DOC family protein n=1 Tax=Corynebacterium flavescens TaxID=28028 RepID=UPI003FD33673